MKKLLFFISLFIFISPNVSAETSSYWGYDIEHFTNGFFRNCHGIGDCSENITTAELYGYSSSFDFAYTGFISSQAQTIVDSAGIMFAFTPNMMLRSSGIYSAKLHICNVDYSTSLRNVNFSTGTSITNVSNNTYPINSYYTTTTSIDNIPYHNLSYDSSGISNTMGSCTTLVRLFKPSTNSTMIGFQFTTSTTLTSQWYAVGYELNYLGPVDNLSTTQIENIVNNATSDLATNNDINQIEQNITSEINEMTSEQQQTNEKLDDLNNNITSEDSPDTSGLSDVAGWLPPGPVDSLINLPLSLFNSISRDLSSTCSPITLPLPYVNKDLTLPCMSSFYNGIGIGDFMDWVGVIASGFILFSYLMKLYKWVDDTLTFRENNHLDNWGGV